ncbi:C2H2 finger domain transcription factor mtfA [Cladobotryum mycophilum]|uniref:C2H2 finger domain transcription factor mtfA n=1 Tax=Cladobotryum mycophilum TaxID=491253 RepID=A0ABR0SHE9_9HYPO
MAMVTSLIPSHYNTQQGAYHRYAEVPRSPPSPPMDEYKCSLPSISNLLGLADAGSPSSEASVLSRRSSPRPEVTSQALTSALRQSVPEAQYAKTDSRPGSSYSRASPQHRSLPPTPPMTTDASFDGHYSPSSKAGAHFTSAPIGRYYETTPPLEQDHRHQMTTHGAPRTAIQTSAQPLPATNYYQPSAQTIPPLPVSGLQYQRSLPHSFPPPPAPVAVAPSSSGFVWQHHHYLNPSHGGAFPPTQDRYICQTCNKAFSRPSSLRIHSHSHTGEKPFMCPHHGCGKAFSVRSNMKRHERGCHGLELGKRPILFA